MGQSESFTFDKISFFCISYEFTCFRKNKKNYCRFATVNSIMFMRMCLPNINYFFREYIQWKPFLIHDQPSWHRHVVTTLSQRRCWRCHNVVTWSKMRIVPTSVSDVVTTSLSDVIKTLPQHCCNVATTFSIGFLGHFTTDYSDFFPFIEMWESYQSTKWY